MAMASATPLVFRQSWMPRMKSVLENSIAGTSCVVLTGRTPYWASDHIGADRAVSSNTSHPVFIFKPFVSVFINLHLLYRNLSKVSRNFPGAGTLAFYPPNR